MGMVDREHERHLLDGLVESLNVGGGAVVIHGEPGMFVPNSDSRKTAGPIDRPARK